MSVPQIGKGGGNVALSLQDKNIGQLFDNVNRTFDHLRAFEVRSNFHVWFSVAWNACNVGLFALYYERLHSSFLFLLYCNIVIFSTVVYCRQNGKNKVQIRGGNLELKSLASADSADEPLR